MRAKAFKSAIITTASAAALLFGLAGGAMADPLPFTINPNAIGVTGYSNQVETDFNGVSDALIQQTGPSQQTETGWVQGQSFTNNGLTSNFTTTGLLQENNTGTGFPNTYGLYLTFTGTVNGITGFGPGQIGTVGPGDYNFIVKADVGQNDIFTSGSTGPSPTLPSVTDTGNNDLVLAVGSSIAGSAGFQMTTGAPQFGVLASFILCDGTAGQGYLGSELVTDSRASSCGTFDARTYFINPVPFYQFDFNSSTSGSGTNLHVDALNGNATLNGVVADINFISSVPEPGTLAMFGLGLLGLGFVGRRRSKQS